MSYRGVYPAPNILRIMARKATEWGEKRPEWGMVMVGRPSDFRHHDVVRAIRAIRAAGVENPSVRLRTPGGTEYFFGGEVKADVPRVRGKATTPVRNPDAVSKGNLPSSKARAPLAEGGTQHMAGKQAADPARPGRTGKPQSAADTKQASGGLSRPARAGSCGT
jgi:hypothetical protein